jgi:hypothetical protein
VIYEQSLGRSSEELEKTGSVLGSVMIRKMKLGGQNMTDGRQHLNQVIFQYLFVMRIIVLIRLRLVIKRMSDSLGSSIVGKIVCFYKLQLQ